MSTTCSTGLDHALLPMGNKNVLTELFLGLTKSPIGPLAITAPWCPQPNYCSSRLAKGRGRTATDLSWQSKSCLEQPGPT